jgi:pimeloyl-ACP methyl ester carboxylesterase
MTTTESAHVNGVEIHYIEIGDGPPLVLLHGGLVSTNPLWDPFPFSYGSHLTALAREFRVIAPDSRGSGRTRHDGREDITLDLLADDAAKLIETLGLERPAVCGFSMGGQIGTVLAIRHPSSVGVVVNDAGYDCFNPDALGFGRLRALLGGSPTAVEGDPAAFESAMATSPQMAPLLDVLKADLEEGQGPGAWRTYVEQQFHPATTWPGYAFADLARIEVPSLVLVGDRDHFCSVEEGALTYRSLPDAELAVLPGVEHVITDGKVAVMADFLRRRVGD